MSAETPSYVGFCGRCGGMNAATVDDGSDPKGVAKFVAKIVSRGDRVERKTVGHVRASAGAWCECAASSSADAKRGGKSPSPINSGEAEE